MTTPRPTLRPIKRQYCEGIEVSCSRMNPSWPWTVWLSDDEVDMELNADQARAVWEALGEALGVDK